MGLWNKKAQELTVGESMKLSVIITLVLTPLAFLPYIAEKVSEWKSRRK